MSLYKREGSNIWWTQFRFSGRRIQQSTRTADKSSAEEYEAKLKASLYNELRLGVRPQRTWNEAVVRYVSETNHKASHVTDIYHLRWLSSHLSGIFLSNINRDILESIIKAKVLEGVKPRTVNAVSNTIRAVMMRALKEWEWIDRIPKFRMLQEPKRRIRFITREEWARLQAELPIHLRRMATFAIETGLRRANVTGLKWAQVDLERKIVWYHADEMKGRQAHPVPLSQIAIEMIQKSVGQNDEFVFCYKGKPVKETGTKAWDDACKRASISDFRWHDLRHTWASWHVQEGTPLHVLQELGGWENAEMVRKYAHLTTSHLAEWVNRRD